MANATKFLATDETLTRVATALENVTVTVPIATTSIAGRVKPDGTTITITSDGTISGADTVPIATTSVAGKVMPDGDTITVDSNGEIAANCVSTTTTDPGEGSPLATGKLLVVLEAE